MVRALVLLPLLAVGLDQARVSFVCGPDAQSCLDAASSGTLGTAGTLLLIGYMLVVAAFVGRMARGRSSLWLVATAGLYAACGGQAVLAQALGTGALIGGGWLPLLAFSAAGGALLALALRTARHAFRLPKAPRLVVVIEEIVHQGARLAAPPLVRTSRLSRDRAPPVFA
ncbi:hypothetical protein OJ997_36070 [Solirubrobacter phytolaccae]|uniref:Uncharacterized protein n=1 Tax=Solirubrobacter phytolaccae TaxID=1404360 RepID=A0A9X3SJZ1_9ACTN|nr:hypothetical protein [Solirubrobacter phytolaccae]MDA0185777.1 hypothetical protein [Solirubrobacter phytolaccae]